jgi:hypothetical protein
MSVATPVRRRQQIVVAATLVCAASMLGLGLWAFLDPPSFAGFVDFAPYNEHLIHDAGAFQVGIGTALLLWFYALGAGLLNAVAHFVFPVLKGGYFPGLSTAVGHLVLSALLLGLLVQESRRLRARPSWSRRRPPAPARPRRSRAS